MTRMPQKLAAETVLLRRGYAGSGGRADLPGIYLYLRFWNLIDGYFNRIICRYIVSCHFATLRRCFVHGSARCSTVGCVWSRSTGTCIVGLYSTVKICFSEHLFYFRCRDNRYCSTWVRAPVCERWVQVGNAGGAGTCKMPIILAF